MQKKVKRVVVIVFLFVTFAGLLMAQNVKTTKSGYWASVSEELLDKAMDYAVAKDYVAIQKLLNSKLVFELKAGLKVYVVDYQLFSGKVKIRPVGETIELWTVKEAITD